MRSIIKTFHLIITGTEAVQFNLNLTGKPSEPDRMLVELEQIRNALEMHGDQYGEYAFLYQSLKGKNSSMLDFINLL